MPAPKGNQYAAKPGEQKKSFKGRITFDAGTLKGRCVKAARDRRMKLTDWLKEKLTKALDEDGH
jgi:acyl-CoA-binding protein